MVLNEKVIAKLPIKAERVQYFDDEVTGFGVRVEPNGRKSFFWYAKVNGKPRFRALGEFPTASLKDARNYAKQHAGTAADWKQRNYEGDDPFDKKKRSEPAAVPTFNEMVEQYIVRHVRENANRPESAEYNVRWITKKHFASWAEKPIDTITVADVLAVKNACGESRYQANRCTEFVRTVFNWAGKSQDGKVNFWRVNNPAADVSCYKEKARDRYLTPEELARFNEALRNETNRDLADFLALAISTGARRSDIFSMRWEDLDWESHTWRVPFPKNAEAYSVSLLPAAMLVLKRRRAQTADSEPFVFPGVGRSGHLEELRKPWEQFREKAAIPDVRMHDLRRTVGSYLAIAGVSLQQIGAALGHKSLQSTQVYAHLHDQAIREAREAGQKKMVEMMTAATKRIKRNDKVRALAAVRP